MEEETEDTKARLKTLQEYSQATNIAELLDKEELNELAERVMAGFDEDRESCSEWARYCERALELTNLKRQKKHTPMMNASNIKYPLIATASIQFTSRTMPELIKSGEVVNYRVVGRDESGAKNRLGRRLKAYLNYQILESMPNWLDERDRLLTHLSIVGTVFTKTWYDPITGKVRSELIPYDEIVVNDGIKTLEEAERVTHIICLSMKEVIELNRFGIYSELESSCYDDESDEYSKPQEFLEQHCWYDLDEDGYPEPYIITVHQKSRRVVRIVSRFDMDSVQIGPEGQVMSIKADQYFSDYHFLPNPYGTFHSHGFGTYLLDMNESVNTILNQLLDAGKLANIQGGFIGAGMRLRSKTIEMEPGEWKILENVNGDGIKNNIVPLNYKEPSTVLFQLLGMILNAAQSFTSTTDALTGTADGQNTSPNTMYALIQQGLKVFSAITRRVGRGYKKEVTKIVDLNRKFLNAQDYINVVDPSPEEIQEMIDLKTGEILDFKNYGINVVPVTDSNVSTEAELLFKSQMEMEAGMAFAQMGVVDPRELAIKRFNALESTNIEKLVPAPQPKEPTPDLLKIQADLQIKTKELELKHMQLQLQAQEMEARIKKTISESIKNIADAEAAEAGSQLQQYKTLYDNLLSTAQLRMDAEKLRAEGTNVSEPNIEGGNPGLATAPADQTSSPIPTESAAISPDGSAEADITDGPIS